MHVYTVENSWSYSSESAECEVAVRCFVFFLIRWWSFKWVCHNKEVKEKNETKKWDEQFLK